jgi:hypothetical protein
MGVKIDRNGGVVPSSLERAAIIDLLTLPQTLTGTNCSNCRSFDGTTPELGFCVNPKVRMHVNDRQCCALWTAVGVLRIRKKKG